MVIEARTKETLAMISSRAAGSLLLFIVFRIC